MSQSFLRMSLIGFLFIGWVASGNGRLGACQELSNATSTLSTQQDRNQKKPSDVRTKPDSDTDGETDKTQSPPVSKQRIEELLAFVDQHHPDIKPLLRSLQKKQRSQFHAAMRTLDREVRSLQVQKEKTPERYELSLKLWISRSKTKLIAARIATAKSEDQIKKLEREMEVQIDRYYDVRQQQLEAELAAIRKRAERIEKQKNELPSQRQSELKRQKEAAARMTQKLNRAANPSKGKTDSGKSKADKDPTPSNDGPKPMD